MTNHPQIIWYMVGALIGLVGGLGFLLIQVNRAADFYRERVRLLERLHTFLVSAVLDFAAAAEEAGAYRPPSAASLRMVTILKRIQEIHDMGKKL